MYLMWNALAAYVLERGIEILFGVASFHGRDPAAHAEALSLLHHRHLAPKELRVRALPEVYQRMDLVAKDEIDAARDEGSAGAHQGLPAARRIRRRRGLRGQ